MSTYTVVDGDTLWKIGVAHGLNPDTATEDMFAANPQLNRSEDLQIGQIVKIPGGPGPNSSDQNEALQITNQARHEASQRGRGRSDLVWDDGLTNAAAQWANEMARTGKFEHSGISGQGENLFGTTGDSSFATASQNWVNEVENYQGQPIGQGDFEKYGHYTQCVWPSATRVGMASAKSGNGWTYTVGRYDSEQLTGASVWKVATIVKMHGIGAPAACARYYLGQTRSYAEFLLNYRPASLLGGFGTNYSYKCIAHFLWPFYLSSSGDGYTRYAGTTNGIGLMQAWYPAKFTSPDEWRLKKIFYCFGLLALLG